MKNYTKIGILCFVCLVAFSDLTPMAMAIPTTIEDSTVPVSDGEFYKWNCTYVRPSGYDGWEKGTWLNITINSVYQGTYMMTDMLLVDATIRWFNNGSGIHGEYSDPSYFAYNATLSLIDLDFPFFIPIPINLTIIAAWYTVNIHPTTVSGNSIILDDGEGWVETFIFNSDGFCTNWTTVNNSERIVTWEFVGGGGGGVGGEAIPFGNCFIIPTVITIGIIVIFVKKRLLMIK